MSRNRRFGHADLLVGERRRGDPVAQDAAESRTQDDRCVERTAGAFAQQIGGLVELLAFHAGAAGARRLVPVISGGTARPSSGSSVGAMSPSRPPLCSSPTGGSLISTNGTGFV